MTKLTIACAIIMTILALVVTNKKLRMDGYIEEYQACREHLLKEQIIARAKGTINTKLLPSVLSRYRDERDIQFTIAMIDACRSNADNQILWNTARNTQSSEQIRIIALAHLLSRGYVEVWGEVTEKDMEVIAVSMPVHIVHWRQLMLQYSGRNMNFLRRDTFPERHRFKALFKECMEKFKADETRRIIMEISRSTHPAAPATPHQPACANALLGLAMKAPLIYSHRIQCSEPTSCKDRIHA